MPSLIQNHRKKEVETKLAKVYSVMNQAVQLSSVEYGDVTEWGGFYEFGLDKDINLTSEQVTELFKKYFGKHIKYTSVKPYGSDGSIAVYFNDGTILRISEYVRDMQVFINKNALNNPKIGVNQFGFRFSPVVVDIENTANTYKYHLGKGFEPYAWNWDGKPESLYENDFGYGCAQNRAFCTKLIQLNGWKIPDNYPLKF